jgi:hypothetical protein
MHSNALEYDIYAEVSGDNISTLNFQADNEGWMDEMFVRVSDDATSKDADAYVALIEKQLNTKLERPADTFEVQAGGFIFQLPKSYAIEDFGKEYQSYEKTDGTAKLAIYYGSVDDEILKAIKSNEDKASEILEVKLDELLSGLLDDDEIPFSEKRTDNVKPDVSMGNTHHYSVTEGSDEVRVYESWALDTSAGEMILVLFIDMDTKCKNSDEYLDIIRNAVPKGHASEKASSDPASTADKAAGESKETGNDKKQTEQKSGVDPELKAFLDSYEDFVDEYVEFMKKYQEDPTNAISMLSEYADIMQKYVDFADKVSKYNSSNLSTEDYKYYIEVTSRCTQKMLDIY